MGLFGKVFLLVIAQIVLMVVCVYQHTQLLSSEKTPEQQPQTTTEKPIIEEPKENEPLKKMVKDSSSINSSAPTPSQPSSKENIKKEESKQVTKEVQKESSKPAKKSVEKSIEKNIEKPQEPASKKEDGITDAKVKALFDKKKAQNEKDTPQVTAIDDETIKSIQTQIEQVIKENRIIFKRLSTDVTEKSMQTIEKIAEILKQYPNVNIEVGGHTDAKGDEEVNAYISKHRALSVRKLLISLGVNKERLSAKGYGESQPIVKNDPQGYSIKNRRVEFKVIKE